MDLLIRQLCYPIEVVEEHLRSLPKIRLQGFNPNKSISDTDMILAIIEANNIVNTHYADNGMVQSTKGKRRSSGDLYRIFIQYKGITLRKFLKALSKLVKDNVVASYNCGQIRKRVFHFASDRLIEMTNGIITGDGEFHDEYGWLWPASKSNVYLNSGGEIDVKILNYGIE